MKQNLVEKYSPRSTDDLLRLLAGAEKFDDAMAALSGDFTELSFPESLSLLMRRRGLSTAELGALALLSRSFMYQIVSGDRLPSRDIVLRLSLVMELNVEETQCLLRAAGRGKLYPRVRRDAVLLYALTHGVSLAETDDLLASAGEASLLK